MTKRFFKRVAFSLPIEFQIDGKEENFFYSGEIGNLTYSGAQLMTKNEVATGQRLKLAAAPSSTNTWLDTKAEVMWTQKMPQGYLACGLKFYDGNRQFADVIHFMLTRKLELRASKMVIVFSLGLLALMFPSILVGGIMYSHIPYKEIFVGFITFVVLERLWETFLTSKTDKSSASNEDWTISAVVFYYVFIILALCVEYFFFKRTINLFASAFGAVLLILSFLLRWWGVKALEDQWRIYVAEGSNGSTSTRRLIKKGPYRFVRHPIYLGVMMELVALPLIPNAFLTLLFAAIVNVPLQIFRSRFEEQYLFNTLPNDFAGYRFTTNGFIPNPAKNWFYGNRQREMLVDFDERRRRR